MKIQPIAAPPQAAPPAGTNVATAQEARQRAIARLTQSPVQNQNAIQPEEMGAIKAATGQNHVKDTDDDELEAPQTAAPDSESSDSTDETQEAAPAEETKPVEEPLSAQHLALIRREKALRAQAQKQEQAFAAREQALKQQEAALAQNKPDLTKYVPKDQIKQNALQVLADAGVSYEELTQQILNQGAVDPRQEARASALEAKIAALEQAAEEAKKSQATAQDEQYKTAIRQIESDVKKMVFTGEEFEMIKVTNSVKDVVELIEATWKEKGEILTNEEAAQQVEDYLLEEASKLASTNKMKKRLAPAASKQVPVSLVQTPGATTKQAIPTMKTLTNTNSSSRQMSARERALLAFKGDLK